MNQKEFIKLIIQLAEKREIELSQSIVKELLAIIEEAVDTAVLNGNIVKVLGLKFEQVEKAETSGVTKLGGVEKAWTKPAHKAAKVSYLPSKKKELERLV